MNEDKKKELKKWKHFWNEETEKQEKVFAMLDEKIKVFEVAKANADAFNEKRAAYVCASVIRVLLDLREALRD